MSGGKRRARRVAAGLSIFVAVGLAVVAVAATLGVDPSKYLNKEKPAKAASQLPPETAEVTKTTLTDEAFKNGELTYGTAVAVANRLQGTVTSVPAASTVLNRGDTIYKVDDLPVVLMYGSLPAYRELAPGAQGNDVKQFEENLAALGYTGFTVDENYTEQTATAVRTWQRALGLTATGTVELGRVVYAPGQLRVDTVKGAVGDEARPGEEILKRTGTDRYITVEVDVADQEYAVSGATVTLRLPNGETSTGTITGVETFTETNPQTQEAVTKVRVTITPADQSMLTSFTQASISVGFRTTESKDVLAVPVAALLALGDGGYGVQVVDGSSAKTVPVETGLFANGMVEISGDGIAEGMKVGVPK